MLIFSLQCNTFEYSVDSPTDAAIELAPGRIGVPARFDNCLFLLVAVQTSDGSKQVARAAKALGKVVRATGVKHLVVNGFAGLTKDPADPEHSRALLDSLYRRLVEREPELPMECMPFGWRKRWTMDVIAGQWAQRAIHV